MKSDNVRIFFGVLGVIYILFILVSSAAIVGTTAKADEFTWADFISFILFLLSFHVAIQWVKEVFKDD